MMKNRKIYFIQLAVMTFMCIIVISPILAQDSLKTALINEIETVNEVHELSVGRFMDCSNQYFRYKKLTNLCTESELLDLVYNHKSAVVKCYAGWGLIDKKHEGLPQILNYFLDNDSIVTNVGSVIIPRNISTVFYHHYWQNIEIYNRASDIVLNQLDSVIIYTDNSSWLLKLRAFENRVYTDKDLKRIEFLAFKEKDYYALKYLFDWHRGKYQKSLEKSLSSFCIETNFKGNIDIYYEVIEMLLLLNTIQTKLVALEKLRKDNFWRNVEEDQFLRLFDRFYIYNLDGDIEELENYIKAHQLERF